MLSQEIKKVINMNNQELKKRKIEKTKDWKLFKKHQEIIENRDGKIGKPTG